MEEKTETATPYKEFPICRTCLNVIKSRSYRLQENSGCGEGLKISHVLRFIVPELYLGLSNSPEICGNCRESLRVAFTFRKLCLETETMIGNYLKNVRCTAQVIDLSAVISYLSNQKTQKNNAEKIISEWEDDSQDDTPLGEARKKDGRLVPPFNMQLHAPSTTSTEDLIRNAEECPSGSLRSYPPAGPRIAINTSTGTQKKVEVLDFDSKCGHYLSSSGKKYKIKESRAVLINDPEELSRKGTRENVKTYQPARSESQSDKTTKKQPVIRVVPTNKLTGTDSEKRPPSKESQWRPLGKNPVAKPVAQRDQVLMACEITGLMKNAQGDYFKPDGSVADTEEVDAAIRKHTIINTTHCCEETGLLKNDMGEYFNIDGTPMTKDQVEAEKKRAKIRGESFFQITNVCTVTDEEKNFDEDRIPVNLIPRDLIPRDPIVRGGTPSEEPPEPIDYTEPIDINQFYPKYHKPPMKGGISVKKHSDLFGPNIDNMKEVDTSHYRPILPRLLEAPPISEQPEKAKIMMQTTFERLRTMPPLTPISEISSENNSLVLNPFMRFSGSPDISSPECFDLDSPPARTTPPCGEKPKTNILNFLINKNVKLPEIPVFRLNQQSQSIQTSQAVPQSKAKNTPFSAETIPDYTSPNSDIQMFSPSGGIQNLFEVKEEPLDLNFDNALSEDTLSAADVGEFEPWQNMISASEDTNYVDVPEFVKINNVSMMELESLKSQQQQQQRQQQTNEQIGMNNNQIFLGPPTLSDTVTEKDETAALAAMVGDSNKALWECLPDKFPYNGRMLVKCGNYYRYEDESLEEVGDKVTNKKERMKRKKFKLVPVDEPIKLNKTNEQFGDQTCFLNTSYTPNGYYINDHDYLVAPYVQNKILYQKGQNLYCVCYICGDKHVIQRHVGHMLSHNSTCVECKLYCETPYMLNIHMKTHAKPCKVCTDVIPPHLVESHNLMHKKQEEVLERIDDEDLDRDEDYIIENYSAEMDIEDRFNRFKTCFVPTCRNNSKNSPKIFIPVPVRDRNWFSVVGRIRIPIKHDNFWCCEDHFNLAEDSENWAEYTMSSVKLKLRPNVIPHINLLTSSTPRNFSQLDFHFKRISEHKESMHKKLVSVLKKQICKKGDNSEEKKDEKDEKEEEEEDVEDEEDVDDEDFSDSDKSVHFEVSTRSSRTPKINTRLRSRISKEKQEDTDSSASIPSSSKKTNEPCESPEPSSDPKTDVKANKTKNIEMENEEMDTEKQLDKSKKSKMKSDNRKLETDQESSKLPDVIGDEPRKEEQEAEEEIQGPSSEKDKNNPLLLVIRLKGNQESHFKEPESDKSLNETFEKTDEDSKHVPRKTRKKKRKMEVDLVNEEEMTKKRVLRTRTKKPKEDEKSESPR